MLHLEQNWRPYLVDKNLPTFNISTEITLNSDPHEHFGTTLSTDVKRYLKNLTSVLSIILLNDAFIQPQAPAHDVDGQTLFDKHSNQRIHSLLRLRTVGRSSCVRIEL